MPNQTSMVGAYHAIDLGSWPVPDVGVLDAPSLPRVLGFPALAGEGARGLQVLHYDPDGDVPGAVIVGAPNADAAAKIYQEIGAIAE